MTDTEHSTTSSSNEEELSFLLLKSDLKGIRRIAVLLYKDRLTPTSTKNFSFQFASVAEKFEKISKLKLLSAFPLATQKFLTLTWLREGLQPL